MNRTAEDSERASSLPLHQKTTREIAGHTCTIYVQEQPAFLLIQPADANDLREMDLEMEAIAQANAALGSWRLDECDLYVTLEPCPMCAGAILNARIRRVYYGARDEVMGACGGVLNLFMEGFPRPPQLVGNVCGDECRDVLQTFFREVREKNGENTNRSADIVEDFTEF